MGDVKKGICNVPCVGIVRTVTGESSPPSWLHLVFGVLSPLSCQFEVKAHLYLFIGLFVCLFWVTKKQHAV